MTSRLRSRAARGQRGAALLTAMIIVTLVATLASAMVWQQWRAVQVESAERARAQASWILAGALDFALLILREDQRNPVDKTTRLTEPWATPLAESRLSTFLSADNSADDGSNDGVEAFLSGTIADAQAKFNINNLVYATEEAQRTNELKIFRRLCDLVNVDASVATQIAAQLVVANKAASGDKSEGSTSGPLRPLTLSQLTWLGVSPTTIRLLEPFVVLLPEVTVVNVNTAPREVLAAATGVDLGTADLVAKVRQRKPFKNMAEAATQFGLDPAKPISGIGVIPSRYFEVAGRLRLSDHVITQYTLVQRVDTAPYRKVLRREFVSTVEEMRNPLFSTAGSR